MATTAPARTAGADESAAGGAAAAAAAMRPAVAAADATAAAPPTEQQQPTTARHHHKSSGGGSGLARLLAAAFSSGSEGNASVGPSPRIGAAVVPPPSDGGGSSSSAGGAGSGTRTPPLSERLAPFGLSVGGAPPLLEADASLGGGKQEQQQQQQQEKKQPAAAAAAPRRQRPFWRLGEPEQGRGARVERHSGGGPAGGVIAAGPWGVRGVPGVEPASLDYFPRVGVRVYTDGVQGPGRWNGGGSKKAAADDASASPPTTTTDDDDALTPLGRAVAVASLLAYVGFGHCLLAVLYACFFTRSTWAWALFFLAVASLWLPAAPLYLRSIHLGPLMRCWRRYFRFSYAFETRLDASRPYVVAQFPHGAFPLGQIVGGSFMACEFEQHTLLGLAASAVFLVPGWRHVNSWFGALPATSHNFRRLLRRCTRAARGEVEAEGARAEREAVEAGARAASEAARRSAEEAAANAETARAATAAAAEAEAAATAAAAAARLAPLKQVRHRSPSPRRAVPGGALPGRPTSAPPSGSPASGAGGPFSSPGAARAALLGGGADGGSSSPAAAAAAAFGANLPRLEATVSAPPVRSADVERAAMLARLRRADSILSDPGARALAGRGLSDDDDDDDESGSSSGGGSSRGGLGLGVGGGRFRESSVELSSDPSVINVGGSPPALLEEGEEDEEEEECEEEEQQLEGATATAAATAAAERVAALPASELRRRRPAGDLRPGSPAPGSPRAAVPAPPATPGGRSTAGGGPAAAAASRPATGAAGDRPHHHHHHAPAPIPTNLLPPAVTPEDPDQLALGPYPKYRHPGTSVAVMVGGIAEMFMLRRDAEVLKLRSRKGFVRLALEHGTDILPTYLFGNSAILDFGPRWLQQASRRWRASFGLMYGPWGLPLPRRVPIFMAVGAPVSAGPAMAPTDPRFEARVDEIHAAVCLEIARVYYRWRAEYGWADRPLIIA
jgi:hypothetical protein